MSEQEMIDSVCLKLDELRIAYAKEVPFMSRCIDLVIVFDDKYIAVEFKQHDWKKAVKQAQDHLLGADEVYICIKPQTRLEGIISEVESNGVGVYFFDSEEDNPLRVIKEAQKSKRIWSKSRAWLESALESRLQNLEISYAK